MFSQKQSRLDQALERQMSYSTRRGLLEIARKKLSQGIVGIKGIYGAGKTSFATRVTIDENHMRFLAVGCEEFNDELRGLLKHISQTDQKPSLVILDETAYRILDVREIAPTIYREALRLIQCLREQNVPVVILYHPFSDRYDEILEHEFGIRNPVIVPSILSVEDATGLLTEPLGEFGIEFSRSTLEGILRLTGRHAGLVSLVSLEMLTNRSQHIKNSERIFIDEDPGPILDEILGEMVRIIRISRQMNLDEIMGGAGIYEGLLRCIYPAEKHALFGLIAGWSLHNFESELSHLCQYGIIERIDGTPIISEPIARFFREGLHLLSTETL